MKNTLVSVDANEVINNSNKIFINLDSDDSSGEKQEFNPDPIRIN